jgi:hypothetical protein
MKKDVMKKPYNEEKIGLRIEFNTIRILLIAFFLSEEIFSQIPINGFCQYKNFNIEQNFNCLLSLNYNDDSYSDLILYNPQLKKIVSLSGEPNGSFGKPVLSKVPFEITNIQNLVEENKTIKRYAFTSRQNFRAGIYSFRKNGRAVLSSSIKFNSYPENLSTADVNNNGKDEILVSGSAFNGLSIISQNGSSLKAQKVVENVSFSQAIFADLNNDGLSDIAAFNVLNNNLVFFYNDGVERFNQVRTIQMDQPISSLHAFDMNLDSYTDLVFVKGNSINILYGDFTSSYDSVTTIPTHYYPDQIITGDFNKDGRIDIAYINREEGILSVIYSKGEKSFYPEMIYLQKDKINNLIPYYSKFINGIALISPEGSLYTITNLRSISNNINISTGAKPSAITFFDNGNNGIYDICYIDNFNRSLSFIVRNSAGIPSLFYSYPLFQDQEKIVVDNTNSDVKIFFCYTPGKKLIEIMKLNFKQNKFERRTVYSPGKIEDLKIKSAQNSFDNIYVSYIKNGLLGFSIMEYRDYRYTNTNFSNLATNVYCSNVTLQNGPGVVFWRNAGKFILMQQILIGNASGGNKTLYSMNAADSLAIISYTSDLLNNADENTISFVNGKNQNFAIFTNYKTTFKIKKSGFSDDFKIDSLSQLYFGTSRINGLNKLFVYLPNKNVILRLDFLNKGRSLVSTEIISVGEVYNYFIKNMSFNHFYLVYTDKTDDCIKIKQL